MILCDTNILIEFYKGNPGIIDTLRVTVRIRAKMGNSGYAHAV